jgi:PAS domain S-box-containing protein
MGNDDDRCSDDAEAARFLAISRTATAVVGHDGRVRRTNRAWDALLGRRLDGESLLEHVDEVHRSKLVTAMTALRQGHPADVRLSLVRGDGGQIMVDCELTAEEESEVFYVSARPITARVFEDGRLDFLTWLLRPLDQTDMIGLLLVSNALRKPVYANAAAGRIWQMPDLAERTAAGTIDYDELRERLQEVLVDPAILDTIRAELASSTGRREFEVLLRGDRCILWFVIPVSDESGPIGTLFISRDVTERKVTEARLARALARVEQSEKEFRRLLEVLPDGISVIRDGAITYVNAAALRIYGVERAEQLLGVHVAAFVKADHLPETLARLDRMSKGIEPARVESFLRRDGSTGYLYSQGFPIEIDGAPAILTTAHDMTEQRLLEAKMRQAERLASLGMLSAAIAHEINNPLAYILLNLQATRRWLGKVAGEADAVAGAASTLDLIDQSLEGAERVRTIIRDLCAFSHADDTAATLLDVRSVVDSVIPMVEHRIPKGAKLVRRYDEVALVRANAARLGQVFLNLLVNAAQAIPEGEVGHEICVSASSDEVKGVIVTVRDTGVGIAASVRDRIFDPFFTSKPPDVGTGLGLALCLGIVHALGGDIGVESELGRGSAFRVTLPVASGPLEPARKEPELAVVRRSKILVVDDEPRIASRLAELLQDHDVAIATSGADAIARLADGSFDAVFCDLMMANVKGTDVFEAVVRDQPRLQERFIFMTAGAFTPGARDLLDRVPNPRLDKPFTEAQVRHALSLVLSAPPRQ